MNSEKLVNLYFVIVFTIILGLVCILIWPFLPALIFGSILAGIFYPLLEFIIDKTKLKRNFAAFIVCILIILIIFLPTIYMISELTNQALSFYEYLKSSVSEELIENLFFGDGWVASITERIANILNVDITLESLKKTIFGQLRDVSLELVNMLTTWLNNFLSFLVQFLIMLLVIFALFTEGPALKDFLLALSPLPAEDEELIITKFNQMNHLTIVCNGLGGLIQGVSAGIGFWLSGIQSSLLWTTIMVILAFIPIVGISIVYIPATIFLLVTGKVWIGIFLFIYCTVIALIVENWFKPMFVGSRLKINSVVIFFSILGGMSIFGMAGIFYGPLITTIFLTLVGLYHEKYAPGI